MEEENQTIEKHFACYNHIVFCFSGGISSSAALWKLLYFLPMKSKCTIVFLKQYYSKHIEKKRKKMILLSLLGIR